MDEVYTCICRGQTWTIHEGFIRCEGCRKEYTFSTMRSPKEFNINRESLVK